MTARQPYQVRFSRCNPVQYILSAPFGIVDTWIVPGLMEEPNYILRRDAQRTIFPSPHSPRAADDEPQGNIRASQGYFHGLYSRQPLLVEGEVHISHAHPSIRTLTPVSQTCNAHSPYDRTSEAATTVGLTCGAANVASNTPASTCAANPICVIMRHHEEDHAFDL
jgi:hypothetical protein